MENLEKIIKDNKKKSNKFQWSIARQQAELAVDIAIFLDYESQDKTDALNHLNSVKDSECRPLNTPYTQAEIDSWNGMGK